MQFVWTYILQRNYSNCFVFHVKTHPRVQRETLQLVGSSRSLTDPTFSLVERSSNGFPAYIFSRRSSRSLAQAADRSWQLESPSVAEANYSYWLQRLRWKTVCNFNVRKWAPDVTDAFATAAALYSGKLISLKAAPGTRSQQSHQRNRTSLHCYSAYA